MAVFGVRVDEESTVTDSEIQASRIVWNLIRNYESDLGGTLDSE